MSKYCDPLTMVVSLITENSRERVAKSSPIIEMFFGAPSLICQMRKLTY